MIKSKKVVHSIAVVALLFSAPTLDSCGGGGGYSQPSQRGDVVISKYKKGGSYYLHMSDGRNKPVSPSTYRQCKAGDTYSAWVGCVGQKSQWE